MGIAARWLDEVRAKNAYDYALKFNARDHYGLSEASVERIEHLNIESYAVADVWLRDRLTADGTVQVVYGRNEVCVMLAAEFLEKWQSIFMPARDDAIVIHNLGPGVLF